MPTWPRSFATDTGLDYTVKKHLVEQTLSILKARPEDQRYVGVRPSEGKKKEGLSGVLVAWH